MAVVSLKSLATPQRPKPASLRSRSIAPVRSVTARMATCFPASAALKSCFAMRADRPRTCTLLARKRDILVGPRISVPRDDAEARFTHAWADAIDEGLLP